MHKIAFVCVDYNGWSHTNKFCLSLAKQEGAGVDFSFCCVVVDNSENKINSKLLAESLSVWDWVMYYPADVNLGYFGGLNFGLSKLDLSAWDFVVICNNDLEFATDFCRKIVQKSYSENILSICPDVVTSDGIHQNPHVLNRIGLMRRLKYDLYYSHYYFAWLLTLILNFFRPTKSSPPQPNDACEIHMGIGAIYVLTREFFRKFRKLNYSYFLYGEEAFLSEQIHSTGGILWFDPALRVSHAESAATSKIPKRTVYEFSRQGYSAYRKLL